MTNKQNLNLHFINKRNEVVTKSHDPQFDDPAQFTDSIKTLSKKAGLNIDNSTAVSHWQGDELDVYYAVELLFSLDKNLDKRFDKNKETTN